MCGRAESRCSLHWGCSVSLEESQMGSENKSHRKPHGSLSRRAFLARGAVAGASAWAAGALVGPLATEAAAPGRTAVRHSSSAAIKISELIDSLSDEGFAEQIAGAKQAAAALGVTLSEDSFENSLTRQVASIEDAGIRGLQAVRTNAPGGGATIAGMAAAARQYNLLLLIDWDWLPWTTPLNFGDQMAGFFIPDDGPGSVDVSTYLFDQIGGKGNVLHISGFPGGTNDS